MGTAALWSEWADEDDFGGLDDFASLDAGGTDSAPQYPFVALDVRVELFIDGAWVDIAAAGLVYTRDPIVITGGEPNEGSGVDSSRCTLTINNRDGRFSPRNPRSPYYGLIGRNTPLRVSVGDVGPAHEVMARFVGEVSSWPSRWTVGGQDVWVTIEAAGILRRLTQGATPLKSALLHGMPTASPLAYWPLEGKGAAADLIGGRTMVQVGQVQYGSSGDNPASDVLPDFTGGGSLQARLPSSGISNSWRVECVARFGTGSDTIDDADFTVPLRVISPSGTVNIWELLISGGTAILQWADTAGTYTSLADSAVAVDDGEWHHFRIDAAQSGGNIVARFWVDGALTNTSTLVGKSVDSTSSRVQINPDREIAAYVGAVGHVAYWAPFAGTIDTSTFATGHAGETAASRMERLGDEEDVPVVYVGGPYAESVTRGCGPQPVGTLVDILKDAAAVDAGLLYEPRDALGLAYRPTAALYNQDPALALSYTGHEVTPPLDVTDDDQGTRNDVTVTRRFGSSTQITQDIGALSTQAPPDGVGRYDTAVDIGLFSDGQTADQASWLVHLGTVDEARFPRITVNLTRLGADQKTGLLAAAARLTLGSRITIGNLPAWLPPRQIDQLVRGYTETLGPSTWAITFNTTPAAPYRIATVEDPDPMYAARFDTDDSSLVGSYTASDTTLTVATASGPCWVDSAAHPGDFPFDVNVQGVRLTVTAITGTSSPQTFTVTRSTDGFDVALRDGVQVSLWNVNYIGL